ncbi:hypothetical protein GRX03_07660 [Halovenus sp. WSH3]|uniref:histidine kinase n=1 Tax=Halovenus carboxidivorans TaxID=2692199 RepID=A0A6B0T017_9EURY|nr:hypothetical protein [Halovenus carboxidivorans]
MVAGVLAALAVLTAGIALWVRDIGRGRAATVFIAVLCLNTVWLLAAAASVLAASVEMLTAMLTVRGITSALSGTLFFVFSLYYTGRAHWLTPTVRGALALLMAVCVLAPATNPWTGLTARDIDIVTEPVVHAEVVFGPLSLPIFLVTTLLALVGVALIVNLFLRSRRATRGQTELLGFAVAVPIVLTSGQVLGLLPHPMIPYAPFGIGLLSVCTAVAMFRNQLFVADPVARSSVVEQISDPIVVLGGQCAVIDYNAAADRVFGPITVGDPLDEQLPAILATEDAVDRQYATELSVDTDGSERVYSVDQTELDINSAQRAKALVFRDITDRKQYERQLEQIASTISHDLRNPLSVATGNVELAHESGDTDRLDTARESLERMDRIITDVLELSREGIGVVGPEAVSLEELAVRAWETTETHSAELHIESDGARIEADPERVRRLFENLFRNAVEHGGPDVTVWVGIEDGLYVEDDGPGIPESERGQIFEHGYTTERDNTGFGLDIVDSIAAAHGWTVSVEDGREGGAKFVFEGVESAAE